MRRNDDEIQSIPPDGRPEQEQPQWRRDFPIDWPQDEYVARRDFAKFLVLTSFAFSVGQVWIILQDLLRTGRNRKLMEITDVASLPVGSTYTFDYPRQHDSCLLVRTGEDQFVAYSQKCTHLSCPVQPRPESGTLHCPCHEGTFDLASGRPISGPPRRPLPLVRLEVHGGTIYANGIEEQTT